jgi:L-malate glycosyltransferase
MHDQSSSGARSAGTLTGRVAAGRPAPVLVVTPWFRPTVGGVAEIAERLHSGLNAAGVEAHLLVNDGSRQLAAIPGVDRAYRMLIPDYAFAKLGPRAALATVVRGFGAYRRLRRLIREHGIGTIFLIYPVEHVWPFPLLARETGCRIIPVLQGNDVETYESYSRFTKRLLRWVLREADCVVACSVHLGRTARRIADRELQVHIIPNCVDVQRFTPASASHNRSDTKPTVVHISNFAPKKRTLDIVTAFSRAELPPDARLIMVGHGPTWEATVRLTAELGVADRVSFVGSQPDVRPFLWDADVFVLASESEGAPLVLAEAMACGVPWVSTRWGAAADTPPGECGLVVPARDPEALAEALSRLVRDDSGRRRMAVQGRRYAEESYSREVYIERHVELLVPHTEPVAG